MASYRVVGGEAPVIVRTYNDGVSWQEAKKQARAWYLIRAAALRALRKGDVAVEQPQQPEGV